jgi:nucleoid-associated protein YgaU
MSKPEVSVSEDAIGRAMHEASQVGGPWTPCTVPYGQWPECEHEPMGRHVAVIIAGRALTPEATAPDARE